MKGAGTAFWGQGCGQAGQGTGGTRHISSAVSDGVVTWDRVLFPHLVSEGVETRGKSTLAACIFLL